MSVGDHKILFYNMKLLAKDNVIDISDTKISSKIPILAFFYPSFMLNECSV